MIHNHYAQCSLASLVSVATAAASSPVGDMVKTILVSVITGLITWSITQLLSKIFKRTP